MEVDSDLSEEFKCLTKGSLQFSKKCARIVEDVSSGRLTIAHLVEQLGVLLIDKSPNNRQLGTWILTQVLHGLPPNQFDETQLKFICTFYADRLKDHHQVIPAVLAGVLALTQFEQFPHGAATQILSAIFHNVSCQQQQEQDRYNIFRIFKVLFEKCSAELCSMGLDFVYGVISAVDGERHPRNLVLLFNWFPQFLTTVTLGHLTEETFEVLACYFPVDFKAPTQEPNTITRDQLASSLAPCLTAIPQFAEFCFPLAIEKLDSSLEIAKLDALELLEIGCLRFESTSYVQHATEIWPQIQKEVFSNPDSVVGRASLATLTAMIKKISHDPSINQTVKDIADTVKGNLLPESRLFNPSMELLLSVATASKISCDIIIKEIAPILINTVNITTTTSPKALFLHCLVKFFVCYVSFYEKIEFVELQKVPILCFKASVEDSSMLRKTGLDGLSEIIKFIPSEIRLSLYDNLKPMILTPQDEEVKNSLLHCVTELAKNFPNEVNEKLVCGHQISNQQALAAYLDTLSVLILLDYFTHTVIDIILEYLHGSLDLGVVSLEALNKILLKHENDNKIQDSLFAKKVISIIINWTLSHRTSVDAKKLEMVASILKSSIGYLSTDKQKIILIKELPEIEVEGPVQIFLMNGILCRLKREIGINDEVLRHLTVSVTRENDFCVKNTAAQLLANILNKCSDESILLSYFENLNDSEMDITLLTWITKALVMRNHPLANKWTDKLLKRLDDDENVATAFRVIIDDTYDCLSSKSYCFKSILYQQKFFTIVSNKLSENYRPGRTSYLLAFGYLLEGVPKLVILLQFQRILKLIVFCLDECQDVAVLAVILQRIREFIINKEKCMEDHLSDFLKRFLRLSAFDKSMKIRILALQCLQECPSSFPVYKMLVHKQDVLTVLGKVIDDKKRIVRKEAVEARSLWFLLDSPLE